MTDRLVIGLLIACSLLPAAFADASAPQSIQAQYSVSLNGLPVAVMQESFELRDNAYRIISETRAIGLLALVQRRPGIVTSSGSLHREGLRPHAFDGTRAGKDPRHVHAEFDWNARTLTLTHDGRIETVALPAGTQDRLSVMYQFLFVPHEDMKRLVFPMTNGRKIDHYRYAVGPDSAIDTPLGRLAVVHLVKQHLAGETAAEIWLAREYRMMPVKMRIIEDDGERYEQVIAKLEMTP